MEEKGEKRGVKYVLGGGMKGEEDGSEGELVEGKEEGLSVVVKNMRRGEGKGV